MAPSTRGETMFQVPSVPLPSMISPVSRSEGVELGHVLTDGAAVIETNPRIDRDPASHAEGVADERGGRHEPAS